MILSYNKQCTQSSADNRKLGVNRPLNCDDNFIVNTLHLSISRNNIEPASLRAEIDFLPS